MRTQLSRAIAGLLGNAAPTSMLPRAPRAPSTFREHHFRALQTALTRQARGSGLAVVAAPPGAGKGEFALSYATQALKDRRYDQVFVLRATDSLRLEQDFLMMARILAPDAEGAAALRRDALRVLETTSRWLIVCHSVADPAILLPFLPWNADGHVLCTYWPEPESALPAREDPWLHYLGVETVAAGETQGAEAGTTSLLEPLTTADAHAFLATALPSQEDPMLDAMAEAVASSRLGAVLARAWLEQTACTRATTDAEAIAHAKQQVSVFMREWDRVGQDLRDRQAPASAGLQAALLLLRELGQETRWRLPEQVEDPERERAAFTLMLRLEPFASGTFPAAVLDDPLWTGDQPALEDRRLTLLERWALADRADRLRHAESFEISSVVRDAVRLLPVPRAAARGARGRVAHDVEAHAGTHARGPAG